MKFTLILLVLVTIIFNVFIVTGANLGRKRDAPLLSTLKKGIVVTKSNSGSLKNQGGDCPNGLSPCPFGGCCPSGTCGDSQCSVPCQSTDPVCGDGCCQPGDVCCKVTVNFCCLTGQTCGGSDYVCNGQSSPTDSPTATPT